MRNLSGRTGGVIIVILAVVLGLFGSGWPGALGQMSSAGLPAGPENIRVSHDAVPIHAEPSVAVNPANHQNLLAASQLIPTTGPATIGTFASFDGGKTWHDNGPLPFPPGANTGDDVTVAFSHDGHGFVAAMVTSETNGRMSRIDRGVAVWRSEDGGRTFTPPVLAVQHEFVDHPWLAIDPEADTDASALYVVWVARDHRGLGFTRSLDDGKTFAARRTVVSPAGGVSIPVAAAGPQGAISVAYETGINGADPVRDDDDQPAATTMQPAPTASAAAFDARVEVISSSDGGATFSQPVALGDVSSEPALTGDVHLATGPSIAADPHSHTVAATYVTYRRGSGQLDVMATHSADGGRSWSTPRSVTGSASGGQIAYFQPQIVIDDAGGVDITVFALARGRVNVLAWHANAPSAPFSSAYRVSTVAFDPAHGMQHSKHGAWWIGDYQGLATGDGILYPLWNDTRTGNLELFAAAVPLNDLVPGGATPIRHTAASPAASLGTPPIAASPAATPTASPAAVQVTTDPWFPDHAEPSLAVNPRNSRNLLGAAQFFAGAGPHPVIGTFVSFDGGSTWHDQAPLPLPTGVSLANDVTVTFDPAGHSFVTAGLGSAGGEGGVAVWRTDDGGRTFGAPVRVAQAGGDHPWLAADPTSGTLYVAWSGPGHRQLLFSRSTDGGRTFTPAQVISGPNDMAPDLAVVTVGRAGTVFVVYDETEIVTSADGGRTFSPPHALPAIPGADQAEPAQALNTLPAAAADPATGTLYVATATSQSATGHQAIFLWRSADGGQTWGDPVPVPLDPSHQADAYQPALAVSPNGQVAVSAYLVYGERVSVAVAWSADHGASFTVALAVAPPFTPRTDLTPASENHFKRTGDLPWIGDYQGLAAGPSAIYPCWTDTSTGQMEIVVTRVPITPAATNE